MVEGALRAALRAATPKPTQPDDNCANAAGKVSGKNSKVKTVKIKIVLGHEMNADRPQISGAPLVRICVCSV